ncbi:uncharacterized protein PGTG_08751 [Puccinia graminis f. sp. tritici CRL 75-36-700-3]|uniref:Uncharacterized protein n=1 Tax=Puccinia graminis f. sp. tritici (strain CRL 75-36-700-3 / race SCCL) TaxID=418459 RepID=E3KEI8_PUCGT|nr:uncharacterized protein PGTG_08751 [Puccinia graminis f. sp. tritici CRL 75-36-700-3]EFP82555.2 hypothetical protein PGTG_08751 [Puccinia graminis f. sp. tritici CRL 75-36-700-3]
MAGSENRRLLGPERSRRRTPEAKAETLTSREAQIRHLRNRRNLNLAKAGSGNRRPLDRTLKGRISMQASSVAWPPPLVPRPPTHPTPTGVAQGANVKRKRASSSKEEKNT